MGVARPTWGFFALRDGLSTVYTRDGRFSIARFPAPQALRPISPHLVIATPLSGAATLFAGGSITPSAVELLPAEGSFCLR